MHLKLCATQIHRFYFKSPSLTFKMPSRDSVRERLARLLNCSSRCRLLLGCCTSTGAGADSSLCFMNKKIRGDKKKRYDFELEGVLLFPIESTYLYLTLESSYDEFHSSIGRVNGLKKCLRPLLIFLFETDFLYIDKLDKKNVFLSTSHR